jgi:hypothetical protein
MDDDTRPTVQRTVGVPADAATVRGLMQELAMQGWAVMPDDDQQAPSVWVREAGAGASEVHVSQPVDPGQQRSVEDALDAALAELMQIVLRRTSDAS